MSSSIGKIKLTGDPEVTFSVYISISPDPPFHHQITWNHLTARQSFTQPEEMNLVFYKSKGSRKTVRDQIKNAEPKRLIK